MPEGNIGELVLSEAKEALPGELLLLILCDIIYCRGFYFVKIKFIIKERI
jgi:hypothetical protein